MIVRISHIFENLDHFRSTFWTWEPFESEVGKKKFWCLSVVKNVEVLWADRWVFVEAQFIISKMGRFEVIFRQFPDTMLTISATMLTRRAMVFFVSEFAYCALGTGPITGVQQVSIWFYFFWFLSVCLMWRRSWRWAYFSRFQLGRVSNFGFFGLDCGVSVSWEWRWRLSSSSRLCIVASWLSCCNPIRNGKQDGGFVILHLSFAILVKSF